jgi:hypothetical protein
MARYLECRPAIKLSLYGCGIAIAALGTFNPPLQLRAQTAINPAINQGITPNRFEVALIGDLLYTPQEDTQFPNLIADINRSKAAFVIHDGDIKGGGAPCTNELLTSRRALFQTFRPPFVLVPGDNEWTDCHRTGSDPIEQLNQLRKVFFGTEFSLGQTVLKLDRQSSDPKFAAYRENVRWTYGPVLFVGLHVVGSNNNLGRTPAMDQEFQARSKANLAWLQSSFAIAKAKKLSGIMLVMQANPGFELPPEKRTGFNAFLEALRPEITRFNKPVVLVHGDSHNFRIDKPLMDAGDRRVMNFTRVETFGTPDVHWVKATIDPSDPNLFQFEPMLVKANLNPT